MVRYWIIAPYNWGDTPEIWQRVWQFDLANGIISIGWRKLGDISKLDQDNLKAAINRTYPEDALRTHTISLNMLWSFYHEIQEGDIIIARRGRKRISGIGTVTSKAYFIANKNTEATGSGKEYPNHINVQWHQSPRDKDFTNMVFGMQTLYETTEETYRKLVEGVVTGVDVTEEEDVVDHVEFTLEKYLEDFIVTNFDNIFQRKLVLYKDALEKEIAQQYDTKEVGIIDILALERSSNSFVVIELKKGRESDKVIGQTLRYMGWVKDNLCKDQQKVKGIIICKNSDPKLLYALKVSPDISAKYFKVDFKLTDNADQIPS